jgi:hypothetical protein
MFGQWSVKPNQPKDTDNTPVSAHMKDLLAHIPGRQQNLEAKLAEIEQEMLAELLAAQPPAEPHQPIDPELAALPTLEAKVQRGISRHVQIHGNYARNTTIPERAYWGPEPLRYRPGYFKQIFRFIEGLSNRDED